MSRPTLNTQQRKVCDWSPNGTLCPYGCEEDECLMFDQARKNDKTNDPACQCLRCVTERTPTVKIGNVEFPIESTRMFTCQICGNKRCPHSDDHRNTCTGSNEPGQPGSRYA
jgi:hypothetical protein